VVEIIARNVPSGLGAPVFDKLEAELAKACMSLPASKGFEVRHVPINVLTYQCAPKGAPVRLLQAAQAATTTSLSHCPPIFCLRTSP
jgi:hypothetical protein